MVWPGALLRDEPDRAALVDAELRVDAVDHDERQRVAHDLARRIKGDRVRHLRKR